MTPTRHDTPYKNQSFGFGSFLLNGIHLAMRGLSHTMEYEARIRFARRAGWALIRFHQPYRRRIEDNLRLIFPDMSALDRRMLHRTVAENIGQSLMEHMHILTFADRIGSLDIVGDGVSALDPNRGALLVTGHFGQWEGVRIAYRHLTGQDCGIFFRPNNNGFYDRHWQRYLRRAGEPILAKGGGGRARMATHLSAGGPLLMIIDQAIRSADRLDFMGQPAKTPLTAAELSLKYDMDLIPAYAIRRKKGTDYKVVFEAPIPPSDPATMTQSVNDSLSARVYENPEQYLWTHRRWR